MPTLGERRARNLDEREQRRRSKDPAMELRGIERQNRYFRLCRAKEDGSPGGRVLDIWSGIAFIAAASK
jgi:hypothetical protein